MTSLGLSPSVSVTAVVVTYNRLELLKQTLAGIASGAMVPQQVLVVDNASTDGTADYLASLDYPLPLDRVHLNKNTGGAGGFTVGIDRALVRHGADLVWVMDDDTEPTENTLFELVNAWENYSAVPAERPAFVASRVVWTNGEDHPMNTMRTMFGAGIERTRRAAAVGARPVRSASFVSVMMDGAVMRRVGLPIADFFIWNDDFEYTTRLAHHRNAIAVPASVAKHHTKSIANTNSNPGPRFYNDVRNKLWVFCRRRTLTPLEKFLYGGSTLRLWVSTLMLTDDKKTYATYLWRGIGDACRPFRSNQEVLAGIYDLELPVQAAKQQASKAADFSVLMSTYAKDRPEFLDAAIRSNVLEQILLPSELVLVKDGPLTAELEAVIAQWQARSATGEICPIKLVEMDHNAGLAAALNEGLKACSYELVARADSDDLSLKERFYQQIPVISEQSELAVLGSAMFEISEQDEIESTRNAVLGSRNIRSAISSRNPIFHPTVVFRKSAVEAVGSYEEVPGAEDYWLWNRMLAAGYHFENLAQPLVKYRTGAGAYARRGGLEALKKDLAVQQTLYNGNMIGKRQLVQNLAVRTFYRLAPLQVRQRLFRTLIGKSGSSTQGN